MQARELARAILARLDSNARQAKRETKIEVMGPSPAFIPRLRDKYRFQIVLKIPYNERVDLYHFLKDFKMKFDIDVDPESLL